jgi:hypothetical protein
VLHSDRSVSLDQPPDQPRPTDGSSRDAVHDQPPGIALTLAEAADACGVGRGAIHRWLDTGAFPNAYRDQTNRSWRITAMIPDRAFGGIGFGLNAIGVQLQPGQEALAAKLEARFGNAVQITVGPAPYHCGIGTGPKCPAFTGAINLPRGLHLTLKLDSSSMPAAGTETAKLIVREDQTTPLQMDPGNPIVAVIVKPGTRTVVGRFGGAIAGTGFAINLHDGQQATINTLVGAWRCDGNPGSTIPPGTYAVRAGISHNERLPDYLAPEVPLTITD